MKIALANVPWPFLAETRVIVQGANGNWHDLRTVLAETGLPSIVSRVTKPASAL